MNEHTEFDWDDSDFDVDAAVAEWHEEEEYASEYSDPNYGYDELGSYMRR